MPRFGWSRRWTVTAPVAGVAHAIDVPRLLPALQAGDGAFADSASRRVPPVVGRRNVGILVVRRCGAIIGHQSGMALRLARPAIVVCLPVCDAWFDPRTGAAVMSTVPVLSSPNHGAGKRAGEDPVGMMAQPPLGRNVEDPPDQCLSAGSRAGVTRRSVVVRSPEGQAPS